MNRELPTGTVTFLFSDIEGSTRLAQALGTDRWQVVLEAHQAIWRAAFAAHGGVEVSTEGDSFFAVFRGALDAVAAAVDAQRGLSAAGWPAEAGAAGLRVRVGLHTGDGRRGGDSYVGVDVHRAARIAAAGNGGQTIVSASTRSLVEASLPAGVSLVDLGRHRLKDLDQPEALARLVIGGQVDDTRALRSLEPPSNLPLELTSFIGRSREVAEVVALVSAGRLVTLTGPGGTGKTRLSLAAAAVLLPAFADGIYFVELAPISDPDLVASTILTTLGVRAEPGVDRERLLVDYLGERRILLVLDNVEQVVSAASLIGRLIAAAPGLYVLATSREVLHIKGEQELAVLPLALPDPGKTLIDPESVAGSEAGALFVARARAVLPGFRLTRDNAPAIAQICAELDGLPLAIELAAARIKVLSPEAIRDRLKVSFGILSSSDRDVPERQRTLRGAIAWSYDLLDRADQALVRRAAIFVGGWSLEAAEAVCDPTGELGRDILDAMAALADKSLVRSEPAPSGEPRFRYLATIREFGLEQLAEAGERPDLARRHAEYFAGFAESMAPHLVGLDVVSAVERVAHEHDNLRAAVHWSIEADEPGPGLRIMGWAWRFWYHGGHLVEGRAAIEDLLGQPAAAAPTQDRAIGLNGAGGIAYWLGDFAAAERSWTEALGINEAVGDEAAIAESHYNLGYVEMINGDHADSQAHFAIAMAIYERLDDKLGMIFAKEAQVPALILEGDSPAAQVVLEEVVADQRARGDLVRMGEDLSLLAAARVTSGKLDPARAAAKEALTLVKDTGTLTTLATALASAGMIAAAAGLPERTATIAGAMDALTEAANVVVAQFAMLRMTTPSDLARAHLDDATFERLYAEGRTMNRAEIIAYALESVAPAAQEQAPER